MKILGFCLIPLICLASPAWSQVDTQYATLPSVGTYTSSNGGFVHGVNRFGRALLRGTGRALNGMAQNQDAIMSNVVGPSVGLLGGSPGASMAGLDITNDARLRQGLAPYPVARTPELLSPYSSTADISTPDIQLPYSNMRTMPQTQTYSTSRIGPYSYMNGPGGMTTTNRIGDFTYIHHPNGTTTTGNTIGNTTYFNGPDGNSTAQRIGDFTYCNGPNGQNWNSQDIGNFTYVHGPGGQSGTIQRIGPYSYGNFTNY